MSCELGSWGRRDYTGYNEIHSKLWRSMLEAHHYLGSGPLCGAQLRYLVRSEYYGWIGGLSYSAVPDGWKVATSG
ncbi:Druantia anti-phage system protein DruA [Candidatus Kuenenia stuttgartiensis]|uniref:Druantia anti-phage system protein DruA n=1 Tax=Kuenenia stuttgartiensis TaxID=174633 RepID=UPI00146BAE44